MGVRKVGRGRVRLTSVSTPVPLVWMRIARSPLSLVRRAMPFRIAAVSSSASAFAVFTTTSCLAACSSRSLRSVMLPLTCVMRLSTLVKPAPLAASRTSTVTRAVLSALRMRSRACAPMKPGVRGDGGRVETYQ